MAAGVVVEMTGDEARLWRSYQKIIQQSAKLEEAQERASRKQSMYQRAAENFGKGATASLGKYVAGFASLSGAIGVASSALSHMKAQSDAALQSLKGLTDQNRRLAQIARGAEDLASLQKRSDTLAAQYGVDRNIVRQTLFAGRSEGFEDYVPRAIELNPLINPESTAKVAGQLPKLFPTQNLSSEEAVALTFTAANKSRLDFEQVAESMPRVAEGANLAGSSPEEALALASVLSSRFASGETTSDRIKAFGTKVGIDPKLKGKGILNAVRELERMDDGGRKKFLGDSQELNVLYEILKQEMGTVEERQGELVAERGRVGTKDSALQQALAATQADPNFRANKKVKQSEIGLEVANEKELATGRADVISAKNSALTRLRDMEGINGFDYFLAESFANSAEYLGAGASTTGLAAGVGAGLGNAFTQQHAGFLTNYGLGGFSRVKDEVKEGAQQPSLEEAAAVLKEAATELKEANRSRPTLSNANAE